jgi:hypothetical protein
VNIRYILYDVIVDNFYVTGVIASSGSPRDYSIFDKMIGEGSLRQDFRFRGFPGNSMHTPRQPVTTAINEDKRRNEDNFVKVFGRSNVFDPGKRINPKIIGG